MPESPKTVSQVVEIPLARVHPNPDNPGPAITEEMVSDLAANIAAVGLNNPIKVMPSALRPPVESRGLGGPIPGEEGIGAREPNPQGTGDIHYTILSGELRYRAFVKLGRAAIPAIILNPTPREAIRVACLDNDVRDRGWWGAYQWVEQLIKVAPELTQREIGVELKMSQPKVNRALQLLPLLNPEARALIDTVGINSNKGIRGISELAAARLAGLGPESPFKPGVKAKGEDSPKLWPYPPVASETQDLVKRALEVAIDRQLTEDGVKGLVKWVKGGGKAEEYQGKLKQPEFATSQTRPIGPAPRNDRVEKVGEVQPAPDPTIADQANRGEPQTGAKPNTDARVTQSSVLGPKAQTSKEGLGKAPWTLEGLFGPRWGKPMRFVASVFGWVPLLTNFKGAKPNKDTRVTQSSVLGPGAHPLNGGLGRVKNPFVATVLAVAIVLFVAREGLQAINYGFNRLTAAVMGLRFTPAPSITKEASGEVDPGNSPAATTNSPLPMAGSISASSPVTSNSTPLATTDASSAALESPAKAQQPESPKAGQEASGQVNSATDSKPTSQVTPSADSHSESAQPKRAPQPEVSGQVNTPAKKGTDLVKTLGDGVKDAKDAVNKADEAKGAVDKAKSLLGF